MTTPSRKPCECRKLVVREATSEAPYSYNIYGLDVLLANLVVEQCEECEAPTTALPAFIPLLKEIQEALLSSPSFLSGSEIRFLRKKMRWQSQDLAVLLGVTPSHLSRLEHGHVGNGSGALDKLLRCVVAAGAGSDQVRELMSWMSIRPLTRKSHGPLLFVYDEIQGWRRGSLSAPVQ